MIWVLRSLLVLYLTGLRFAAGRLHPSHPAQYQPLPSLRDQAHIRDQWTSERVAQIPLLLQKYNAQAWLVRLFNVLLCLWTHLMISLN
jgi:hypothetical protein